MYVKTRRPIVDTSGNVVGWEKIGRFAFSHDTGAAIKGPARADIFWGVGESAGTMAGHINQRGDLVVLVCGVEPLPRARGRNRGDSYARVPWGQTLSLAALR
jgi:membrane-bound lytic murein transglycosylase A